jgi:tetratricopeptide (TPR) repeat protein
MLFANPFTRITLVTVSPLLALAIGCGGGDRTSTTTVATGATVDTAPTTTTSASTTTPPTPTAVSYESAEAVYTAGRYAEAADLFASYTERKAENPWGFYMLGLASWKAGNLAQAEVAFDQALKLDPTHQKSWLNSARVLLDLGRTDEALERVQTALEHDSASGEAWRVLGRAQVELGDADEAVEAYRHAIALDERDVWAMNNLGLVYIQQGRYTEALPPLARATQLRPTAPVFQNNLGQALERSGYPAAAETAYQAALAADSTYAKASLGLERVTNRGEDSTGTDIDVAGLARDFQVSVEQWRGEFATTNASDDEEAAADTVSSSIARDSTSDVVTQPDSSH